MNYVKYIHSTLAWCQWAFPDSPKDLSIYGIWNTSFPQFWHTIPTEVLVYHNFSSGSSYLLFLSCSLSSMKQHLFTLNLWIWHQNTWNKHYKYTWDVRYFRKFKWVGVKNSTVASPILSVLFFSCTSMPCIQFYK